MSLDAVSFCLRGFNDDVATEWLGLKDLVYANLTQRKDWNVFRVRRLHSMRCMQRLGSKETNG